MMMMNNDDDGDGGVIYPLALWMSFNKTFLPSFPVVLVLYCAGGLLWVIAIKRPVPITDES